MGIRLLQLGINMNKNLRYVLKSPRSSLKMVNRKNHDHLENNNPFKIRIDIF